MYTFTKDCLIGVAEIDREHEHLFDLINQTHNLLHSENADIRQTVSTLLGQLKEYANMHFAHEEAYMKKINDPELISQQQEHLHFTNYLNSFNIANLDNTQLVPALENLLNYVSRWIFHHIIGSDTLIGKFQSPFAFTSKYLTNIEMIDNEHKRLFEIIEDADHVIHQELLHDKYDEIVRILVDLQDYTKLHFQDEEKFMKEISYPYLKEQKAAHTIFINKLIDTNLDDLDDNQTEYLEDLVSFLLNWLTTHILHMDKKIGEFVAQQNAAENTSVL